MKIQYQEINGAYTTMVDNLNALGIDGWDVVSLMIRTDANTFRAVMKRERPAERIDIVTNQDPSRVAKLTVEALKKKGK